MVYHGDGFTHQDVYKMPVYLRRFYTNILIKEKENEQKQMEKASKQYSQDPNEVLRNRFNAPKK